MINYIHGAEGAERWQRMTIAEQLGNIGSEVSRANLSEGRNPNDFNGAVARALELFDLTLSDPRWRGMREKLIEIGRFRELFCDAILNGREFGTTFRGLQPYFDQFAILAMRDKIK